MKTRREAMVLGAALVGVAYGAAEKRKIRVAQIGTRHAHASGKMECVRRLSGDYEVLALADLEPSEATVYAGLQRLPVGELLAMPGLDAVIVETALERSCEMALRVVEAGKHVHLDKPGAVDAEEFRRMRQLAEKRGLTVQMGYMLRHNPAFEFLFRIVREGWLGTVTEVDAMMGKEADDGLRAELGSLPGGGMFELGCHLIDAVVTVLGKPLRVQSFSTPSREDGVKDNQLAVLEYETATACVRCNHADPFGGPRRSFRVTGTQGSVEIAPLESGEMTLRLSEARQGFKKGTQPVKLDVPKGRYDGEFQTLARVIRGGERLRWGAEHDTVVCQTVQKAAGMGA
jgi:predicted dehydrogenase